ncbi:TKL protein kinase [Saprolegnia parasitica CBS 223.65]|uniref:TKL protein kinase n=1 Tax=Saprolegnia parasitica (strain CBS 223.65) TaxID=695850 RepID=A0A067BWD8_SAPPC|nr:TKL protein kinase [Saprolegnia parasitica CBS 223.65]KDO22834.1 TKL protein kinase [Saprolegnia parasitica CBS 223.65]|eukprot:XP_012206505.1 TKL protein kinase [Saprolegnia parasitica CBS 223.65]
MGLGVRVLAACLLVSTRLVAGASCDALQASYDDAVDNCSVATTADNVTYMMPRRWCGFPSCVHATQVAAALASHQCNVPKDAYPARHCDLSCIATLTAVNRNALSCGVASTLGAGDLHHCEACKYLFQNLSVFRTSCGVAPGTQEASSYQAKFLDPLSYCQATFRYKPDFPFNVSSASASAPSSTSCAVGIVCACLGSLGALVALACFCKRRRRRKPLRASLVRIPTTRASTVDLDLDLAPYVLRTNDRASMAASSISMSATDVRFDPRIIRFRIPLSEFTDKTLLVHGGQGQIFRARWQHHAVVIKQIANGKDYDAIQEFMQEIRISAALRHPHIVTFLGVAWTTLHDIAIVSEYMAAGDVLSILRDQRTRPRSEQWLQWARPPAALTSKLDIAHQVSMALEYMHSLALVHRDIKAKNVVLNAQFVAKLCDFGISRPTCPSATMTVNKGTVAYMAPEVFTGERYSEKADIYSFGALVAELDLMDTPYAGTDEGQDAMVGDAQIALQVVEGGLRPQFSDAIPADVKAIADDCLAYDAERRPSASELQNRLRKLVHASRRLVNSTSESASSNSDV